MLDWEALIQAAPRRETTQAGACNHQEGVTGACGVTPQTLAASGFEGGCNLVTPETTKTEGKGGDHEKDAEQTPVGEWCCNARAGTDNGAPVSRPVLHYRLRDARNSAGSVIGDPGEALPDLLRVLVQHYGPRLDIESVREAFEERAAILEFEAGMPRQEAEQAAAQEIAAWS